MRVILVHNPGSGDASPTRESLTVMFGEAGDEVVHYATTDSDWRGALELAADLVVAVGGDGTAGPVIAELAGSERNVALLPTGTANNIADTLGIRGDARDVIRRWRRGPYVPFDVWELSSRGRRERMVEAMGGGFFASCIAREGEIEPPTSILGGPIDRAMHMFRERLADEPLRRWDITLDGDDHSGLYVGVEAMNGPFVGPNIALAPAAMPGDGLLDVVLIGAQDRLLLANLFEPRGQHSPASDHAATTVRARDVRLSWPAGVALHLDGQSWPAGDAGGVVEIRHVGSANVYAPSA
jgi:diacylglycerol kinase (ATP)